MDKRIEKGIALQKAGKFDAAAKHYRDLLREDPENVDGLHLLGLVFHEQKDHAHAEALLRKALLAKPHQPAVHHNLGTVLSVTGDIFEAEGHYREALRLRPTYAEAIYNLSGIIKARSGEYLIEHAKALVQKPRIPKEDAIFLLFALGKLHDDIGQYDAAFAFFQKGNELRNPGFDLAAAQNRVTAIETIFNKDQLLSLTEGSNESERPVFIVGMPRSGTSLVEQILSAHTAVYGAGELAQIGELSKNFTIPHHQPSSPRTSLNWAREDLRKAANQYLASMDERDNAAARTVDKMPLNFWHLGLIAALFPNARIIHCRRDPIDTCLSCYFQNFTRGQAYSFDLDTLAEYWQLYHRVMAHWKLFLPLRMHEVVYEELVVDPEKHARDLVAFLGLEWEPACASPETSKRPVGTASRWQVRQPVYRTSVKKGERYARHIAPLLALGSQP